jgi:hypothetical protein
VTSVSLVLGPDFSFVSTFTFHLHVCQINRSKHSYYASIIQPRWSSRDLGSSFCPSLFLTCRVFYFQISNVETMRAKRPIVHRPLYQLPTYPQLLTDADAERPSMHDGFLWRSKGELAKRRTWDQGESRSQCLESPSRSFAFRACDRYQVVRFPVAGWTAACQLKINQAFDSGLSRLHAAANGLSSA